MRKFILAGVLAAAAILPQASQSAPQPSSDDSVGDRVVAVSAHDRQPNRRIKLGVNKAVIVQLDTDARDVLVSNPKIVDAVIRSPRRIFLLGMASGTTNAFFFDGQGHQVLSVEISVQRDLSDLSALIHASLPDTDVHVTGANDGVVLTGTVSSAQDATRAQELANRFVDDEKKVVNMIAVKAHDQVMIKVRVAEMSRTVSKQFGIDVANLSFAGTAPIVLSSNPEFGLVGQALNDLTGGQIGQVCTSGANPLAGGVCTQRNNLQGQFKALEDIGLLHTLAEPNLTAVSGETAKFLAGGSFPVPSGRDQQGNVSVEFKDFGVGLSFTPVVLSENRISLQVSTEVSELTNTGAFTLASSQSTDSNGNPVTVAGVTIPALNVRRADTTVELPSGGSFAIAGLMQHTTKQVLEQFPGLGSMPILGALFRSRDFQNDETELVVICTAYLVNPVAEAKLAAPTDGFVPPGDADTILMGKLNATYRRDPAAAKSGSVGSTGYIVQ
ncbi:MAG TPA: type II and III secretion system protein family protein [Rhizomicrobium sp.]|jgi:pilus assembly protein CpaC